MKIKKEYLKDKIQYYFFLLFPFSIILFNPSKEFLGVLSITDIFVAISIVILFIYLGFNKFLITDRMILLVMLVFFSFISLLVNDQLQFIVKFKYQVRWVFYLGTFILVYNYINKESLKYFKKGLFFATYFVCTYSILQSMFKELFIPTIFWVHDFPDYINITFRAIGTFENPLNLCGFLAFPLGLLQFLKNKTKKEKFLNFLIYVVLILTASKIAFIIILTSLLIYFRKHIKFIVYGSLLLMVSFIVFINLNKSTLESNYIYQRLNNQSLLDGSINTRFHMIGSSLRLIKENPIFGIGYENYKKNYKKLDTTNKNPSIVLSDTSYTAENFILDFYLDNGLMPFLILFILLFEILFLFFSTKNNLIEQFTFPILLFVIVGLIMSARTIPLMYLLFTFLAIIYKLKTLKID
jgi:O-antigen ligase